MRSSLVQQVCEAGQGSVVAARARHLVGYGTWYVILIHFGRTGEEPWYGSLAAWYEIRWLRASALDAEPGWSIATWVATGTRADGTPVRQDIASVARFDVEGKVAYLSDYLKPTDRLGHRTAQPQLSLRRG